MKGHHRETKEFHVRLMRGQHESDEGEESRTQVLRQGCGELLPKQAVPACAQKREQSGDPKITQRPNKKTCQLPLAGQDIRVEYGKRQGAVQNKKHGEE
jgi:hypothetical protein